MKTSVVRICLLLSTLALWSTVMGSAAIAQFSGPDLSGLGSSGPESSGLGSSGSTSGIGGNTATSTAGTPAETFIGSNAAEAFVGGAREATGQQSTNRQFQAFQDNQTASSAETQQTGTPREIRTVLAISFNYPTALMAQQTGRLASANSLSLVRFSSTRPELSGINVSLTSQGTAILTGALPTVESRRLAANLIRLQPGVRKVENQIAVAQ